MLLKYKLLMLQIAVVFMNSPRCAPGLAKALAQVSVNHSLFLQLMFTDQACKSHAPLFTATT